jgi:hypothetical protein
MRLFTASLKLPIIDYFVRRNRSFGILHSSRNVRVQYQLYPWPTPAISSIQFTIVLCPTHYTSSAFGIRVRGNCFTPDSIRVFVSENHSVFEHTRLFGGWHQKVTCKKQINTRGRYILLSILIARRVKYATRALKMPVMELRRPKTRATTVSEETQSTY